MPATRAPRAPRAANVALGPCAVPLVPVRDMSKFALTREQWHAVWRIIGPTAERNLARNPLWTVIACAYLEGLHHGASLQREQEE